MGFKILQTTDNSEIQVLFKALGWISSTFQGNFQDCAKMGLEAELIWHQFYKSINLLSVHFLKLANLVKFVKMVLTKFFFQWFSGLEVMQILGISKFQNHEIWPSDAKFIINNMALKQMILLLIFRCFEFYSDRAVIWISNDESSEIWFQILT